jgi:hypothetical protein
MKSMLLVLLLTAAPAFACNDGSCEPTPEPEPTPDPPKSDSDRDREFAPAYYPCCIMNGEVVPKWDLFRSPARVKMACEKAILKGNAPIYECPGNISPKALK